MSSTTSGRPVMAGVDGSEAARLAAEWAADEAALRSVSLRLVHAVDVAAFAPAGGLVPPQGFFEALESEGQQWLVEAKASLGQRHPGLDIELETRMGHPAALLIERSESAGLVVVGASGAGAISTALLGSVAVTVAARGHCPVAVIPGPREGRPFPEDGPVVVGVDGSPVSEAAIELAFEEASLRRARLVAVHAWTGPWMGSEFGYRAAARFVTDWESVETREKELLAERLAGWREKYPDIEVHRVLANGRPARCLLEHAETAALLVVGSRGRGGFTGLLLGSTSRAVIQRGGCPVLVARPAAA